MTASSDSSPAVSIDAAARQPSDQPATVSSALPSSEQPSRPWWSLFALLLLLGGLGFIAWRVIGGRGQSGMQGPSAFPVEMERLQTSSLEDSAEFVGTLDSQAGVSLQPEADGRVVQVFVSSGDSVVAGDPIMQLSPQRSQSDYNAALASVSAARSARDGASARLRAAEERKTELLADLELQERDYGRTESLVERGALPQEDLDNVTRDRTVAESALSSALEEITALEASLANAEATLDQTNANANAIEQNLIDTTVTSPISGIVGDIPIKLGDYVRAGDQLATITQNQDLDLEVAVPINQAQQLRIGLPVELSLFGQDDVIATGNIRFVSPTTDPQTQTILAKARFSQPEIPLQDEQRLEVRIIWDERPGILVPTTAISRIGGETFVFVPGEPEPPAEGEDAAQGSAPQPPGSQNSNAQEGPPPMVAKLKPVTLGPLQGNDYQVLEGLTAGDTVITSGLLNLRDGVPIMEQQENQEAQSGAEQPGSEQSGSKQSGSKQSDSEPSASNEQTGSETPDGE